MQNHIVDIAKKWVGTPYCHQHSCQGVGTDCLGLIRGIWREAIGEEPVLPPAYTMDWAEPTHEEVLLTSAARWLHKHTEIQLSPGAVLLFRMRSGAVAKHLGILSATTPHLRFIHAYSGHGVVENTLTDPWRRRVVATFAFPE